MSAPGRRPPLAGILIGAGAAALLLAGPVASWLQEPATWLPVHTPVGGVYLLAGQSGPERIDGVADYLLHGADIPLLLLPRCPSRNRWSRVHQRNLDATEWTLVRLEERLAGCRRLDATPTVEHDLLTPLREARHTAPPPADAPPLRIELLDGRITGTDDELESLARHLAERPALGRLALATSRFHIRRTRLAAERRLPPALDVTMLPARSTWRDRAPWVVARECLQLLRDRLGLARAPLLHRGWWQRLLRQP